MHKIGPERCGNAHRPSANRKRSPPTSQPVRKRSPPISQPTSDPKHSSLKYCVALPPSLQATASTYNPGKGRRGDLQGPAAHSHSAGVPPSSIRGDSHCAVGPTVRAGAARGTSGGLMVPTRAKCAGSNIEFPFFFYQFPFFPYQILFFFCQFPANDIRSKQSCAVHGLLVGLFDLGWLVSPGVALLSFL